MGLRLFVRFMCLSRVTFELPRVLKRYKPRNIKRELVSRGPVLSVMMKVDLLFILLVGHCKALVSYSPQIRTSQHIRSRQACILKLDDEQRQAYESLYEGGFKAPDVPIAGIASDVPMQPMDYARFFGTIAGFVVFFYAIAAVMKR